MGKKKVAIDTSAWISVFLKKELAKKLMKNLDKIEIFISKEILLEILRALEYPKVKKAMEKRGIEKRDIILNIILISKIEKPRFKVDVCRDKEDNKFIELALTVGADIVSRDRDLLDLKEVKLFGKKVKIFSLREFLEMLEEG